MAGLPGDCDTSLEPHFLSCLFDLLVHGEGLAHDVYKDTENLQLWWMDTICASLFSHTHTHTRYWRLHNAHRPIIFKLICLIGYIDWILPCSSALNFQLSYIFHFIAAIYLTHLSTRLTLRTRSLLSFLGSSLRASTHWLAGEVISLTWISISAQWKYEYRLFCTAKAIWLTLWKYFWLRRKMVFCIPWTCGMKVLEIACTKPFVKWNGFT